METVDLRMNKIVRRASYIFLCVSPLPVGIFAGARDLRISGAHQALGGVLFLLIAIAARLLGGRTIKLTQRRNNCFPTDKRMVIAV
jgi:hypothetical protein